MRKLVHGNGLAKIAVPVLRHYCPVQAHEILDTGRDGRTRNRRSDAARAHVPVPRVGRVEPVVLGNVRRVLSAPNGDHLDALAHQPSANVGPLAQHHVHEVAKLVQRLVGHGGATHDGDPVGVEILAVKASRAAASKKGIRSERRKTA